MKRNLYPTINNLEFIIRLPESQDNLSIGVRENFLNEIRKSDTFIGLSGNESRSIINRLHGLFERGIIINCATNIQNLKDNISDTIHQYNLKNPTLITSSKVRNNYKIDCYFNESSFLILSLLSNTSNIELEIDLKFGKPMNREYIDRGIEIEDNVVFNSGENEILAEQLGGKEGIIDIGNNNNHVKITDIDLKNGEIYSEINNDIRNDREEVYRHSGIFFKFLGAKFKNILFNSNKKETGVPLMMSFDITYLDIKFSIDDVRLLSGVGESENRNINELPSNSENSGDDSNLIRIDETYSLISGGITNRISLGEPSSSGIIISYRFNSQDDGYNELRRGALGRDSGEYKGIFIEKINLMVSVNSRELGLFSINGLGVRFRETDDGLFLNIEYRPSQDVDEIIVYNTNNKGLFMRHSENDEYITVEYIKASGRELRTQRV